MASPSPPLATFISSMDLVFSDDEGDAGPSSASSSRNGTPSSSLGMSGETESALSTSKGRMVASSGGRMSVRASKASALAALQLKNKQQAAAAAAASTSAELTPEVKSEPVVEEEPLGAHPSKNSARRAMKLPRAPPLDFSTLRTEAPRLPNPPPRQKPRLFELEEAPVYHPTIEEFAQPMEYIESIAQEARQFGICKIVPPEGWRPTFAIDTEVRSSCSLPCRRRLTRWTLADFPLQDPLAAAQLDGGDRSRQSQLPRAAVSLSPPAR